MAGALSAMAILSGNLTGLVLLFPLLGALVGFLWFNFYPARVFPGDTMTLMVGAVIAIAGLLSKLEFWAGLLFVPHVLEFFIKALSRFPSRGWGGDLGEDGKLHPPPRRAVGLGQLSLKALGGAREDVLVGFMLVGYALYAGLVVLGLVVVQNL
jgi:UDP-N-acetylglucosamine--dolichyl-phosphate N-acetylglucosaminephosphotransferase